MAEKAPKSCSYLSAMDALNPVLGKPRRLIVFMSLVLAQMPGWWHQAPALGATLFHEDFNTSVQNFLDRWLIVETGDQQMTWELTGSSLRVRNESSSGSNDQSIIFAQPIDTTGYENVYVDATYWANDEDDFEGGDFIRLQGYDGTSPADGGVPIVELSSEGQWSPQNNPPTTPTTLAAFFGSYSVDNVDLWIAVELNTSLDRESLYVGSLTVSAELIPEPITCSLFAAGGIILLRRLKR